MISMSNEDSRSRQQNTHVASICLICGSAKMIFRLYPVMSFN